MNDDSHHHRRRRRGAQVKLLWVRTSPRTYPVRHRLGMSVDDNGTPVRTRPRAAASHARRASAVADRTPWRRPAVTR